VTSDGHARKDHRAVPQPRPGADGDRTLGLGLPRDRRGEILVSVVLVGDVDVVPGPYVVADRDGKVTHDSAVATDQATVPDRHHRRGEALLARHHSCRQRHTGSDEGVATDGDVALVEDRRGRPHDETSLAEGGEPAGTPVTRCNRRPACENCRRRRPQSTDRAPHPHSRHGRHATDTTRGTSLPGPSRGRPA